MKLLYITSDFSYNPGGIYQHIENLTFFASKNNQVVIIYLNQKKEITQIDEFGRKIYYLLNKGSQIERLYTYPLKKIESIIDSEKADIIHNHTLFDSFKLKKTKEPFIFTNHSSSYLNMNSKYLMRKFVLPLVLKKFDLIIAPSTELFEKSNHKNKKMIPNGVNIDIFNIKNRIKYDKNEILLKYKIENKFNRKIFLSTRRLADKNGILDFIKVNISYFKENTEKIAYLIIGNGEQFNEIDSIIKKEKISNIYLLGEMKNEEIRQFYYISDFSIIPSKMEAISISALESMACGCIVLANKVGGLAELIQDHENGIFIKELSLEKTLLNSNNEKLDIIKERAFNNIKNNYSWETITNLTIKEYQKLTV